MKDLSIFINNLINALGRISCFLGSVKWILGRGLDQTKWLILAYAMQEFGWLFGNTVYFFGVILQMIYKANYCPFAPW